MSIHQPSKYGVIFLRSVRTNRVIAELLSTSTHARRNAELFHDEHLAGFTIGWSPVDVDAATRKYGRAGLTQGLDYVLTLEGVLGDMPPWLQEDEDGRYSVPGTGGPPRSTPRLTERQRRVVRLVEMKEAQRAKWKGRLAAAQTVASRRWPDQSPAATESFVRECRALAAFVDDGRNKGPSRVWVEKTYARKTWYVGVPESHRHQLSNYVSAYDRAPTEDKAAMLPRMRFRAAEYLGALEQGGEQMFVDVECFEEWRSVHFRVI